MFLSPRTEKPLYSKYSPYADLFCYWNGNDTSGSVHSMSSALAANVVIRNTAIFVRGIARIMVIADGQSQQDGSSTDCVFQSISRLCAGRLSYTDDSYTNSLHKGGKFLCPLPSSVKIGIHEMMNTMKFYQITSFNAVNRPRTSKRRVLYTNLAFENIVQNLMYKLIISDAKCSLRCL